MRTIIRATDNSTYPKVAVQWLNQALCFYQSFCLVDNEVLLNRHLRVAAKRDVAKYASLLSPHRAGAPLMTCSPLRGLRTS